MCDPVFSSLTSKRNYSVYRKQFGQRYVIESNAAALCIRDRLMALAVTVAKIEKYHAAALKCFDIYVVIEFIVIIIYWLNVEVCQR